MYYIHTPPNGPSVYPFTLFDLRHAYPNVSFPEALSDEEAAEFYCFCVNETQPPVAPSGKKVVQIDPTQIDGQWFVAWALEDYTQGEIDAQWESVRAIRNTKLENCDWTQLPDAPVDAAAWAAYRQELRDITTQTDPFNIVWPQEPG